MMQTKAVRIERDLLGEKEIPYDAYYGIQTMRAAENFPITGYRLHRELIQAMATVKKAASRVAKEALQTGKSVRELCIEYGLLNEKQLNDILDPYAMTSPGIAGKH